MRSELQEMQRQLDKIEVLLEEQRSQTEMMIELLSAWRAA